VIAGWNGGVSVPVETCKAARRRRVAGACPGTATHAALRGSAAGGRSDSRRGSGWGCDGNDESCLSPSVPPSALPTPPPPRSPPAWSSIGCGTGFNVSIVEAVASVEVRIPPPPPLLPPPLLASLPWLASSEGFLRRVLALSPSPSGGRSSCTMPDGLSAPRAA